MKKWLVPLAAGVTAAAAIAGVTFAVAGGFDSDGDSGRESTRSGQESGPGDGAAILPVCAVEAPDCDDMVVNPGDGSGDEPAGDPNEPVSSEPITIIDDMDPNECNLVHNIIACEAQATALARADLAARLGISEEKIDFTSAHLTEWSNSCLGVSTPDVFCAEVITPGFKILLEANGQAYEYHTDMGTTAVLAE